MKAAVIVTLKPTVLDPQGMTIHRAMESLGFSGVRDIRQGKYFEVQLQEDLPPERHQELVERLARDVLTNPVIEEYRIVWK